MLFLEIKKFTANLMHLGTTHNKSLLLTLLKKHQK